MLHNWLSSSHTAGDGAGDAPCASASAAGSSGQGAEPFALGFAQDDPRWFLAVANRFVLARDWDRAHEAVRRARRLAGDDELVEWDATVFEIRIAVQRSRAQDARGLVERSVRMWSGRTDRRDQLADVLAPLGAPATKLLTLVEDAEATPAPVEGILPPPPVTDPFERAKELRRLPLEALVETARRSIPAAPAPPVPVLRSPIGETRTPADQPGTVSEATTERDAERVLRRLLHDLPQLAGDKATRHRYDLATSLLAMGRTQEAATLFERLLSEPGLRDEALEGLLAATVALGRHEGAYHMAGAALSWLGPASPARAGVAFWRARAAEELGRHAEAATLYLEVLGSLPELPQARARLATLRTSTGER